MAVLQHARYSTEDEMELEEENEAEEDEGGGQSQHKAAISYEDIQRFKTVTQSYEMTNEEVIRLIQQSGGVEEAIGEFTSRKQAPPRGTVILGHTGG